MMLLRSGGRLGNVHVCGSNWPKESEIAVDAKSGEHYFLFFFFKMTLIKFGADLLFRLNLFVFDAWQVEFLCSTADQQKLWLVLMHSWDGFLSSCCLLLQELCLQTKLLANVGTSVADFLSLAPEPPSFLIARNAVNLLQVSVFCNINPQFIFQKIFSYNFGKNKFAI